MHSKGRVIEKEQESRDGPKQRDRGCYLNHQQASCISQDESFPIHYPFISFQPPLCIGFVSCEYVLREMGKEREMENGFEKLKQNPCCYNPTRAGLFCLRAHNTIYIHLYPTAPLSYSCHTPRWPPSTSSTLNSHLSRPIFNLFDRAHFFIYRVSEAISMIIKVIVNIMIVNES